MSVLVALARRLGRLGRGNRAPARGGVLGQELGQVLGFFRPGGNPLVFSPLSLENPWPAVTAAHEQTHLRLTNSTTYGSFYRHPTAMPPAVDGTAVLNAITEAKWFTQESAATYCGLSVIASDRTALDAAIGLLPSQMLGQHPYREAFDILHRILPLRRAPDHLTLQAYPIIAEAIATWALRSRP
jgi:hypothetical protein